MKSLTKNNDGFISIIAIGVFALLMIFAISLQVTVIDTLQNLKNGVNYDQARDVADSTMEYIQNKMKAFEPGLNATVDCDYNSKSSTANPNANSTGLCADVAGLVGSKTGKVSVIVKGRSIEALKSNKCGMTNCYVTPIPGTGDAGKNCAMYKPNSTTTNYIDIALKNTDISAAVDQADYTCNWNKLVFGSNQTDRVAVPLYYDNATSGLSGQSSVKNPFKDGTATKLVVRLRTPCKPCATASASSTGANTTPNTEATRTCANPPVDESLCEDKDRYQLDATTSDDIVVQWTINGECIDGSGKTEACGVMPIPKGGKDGKGYDIDSQYVSALYESKIVANTLYPNLSNPQVIGNGTLTYDSNNYPNPVYLLLSISDSYPVTKLTSISKPVLTLFLSKPLLTANKSNIPYLEYQVLTDQPIGNTKSSFDVTVNVEGNSFKKTLTQDVQKALIDFAIHN